MIVTSNILLDHNIFILRSDLLTLGAARVTVVVLSVTTLAATYLVCECTLQSCKITYGLPNA